MINYYEILGLSQSAGIAEIKASFRQLAKLYHPDKNPAGIEHFTKILKAYEILSDPGSKVSYDYKLNYHKSQNEQEVKNKAATKTWKFDEREMKRRQYYNEHIKKYAKQTSEYVAQAETKKNYNEFKYILFATPLAVILFLLIMNLSTRDRKEIIGPVKAYSPEIASPAPQEPASPSELSFGEAPYTVYFGNPVYNAEQNYKLSLRNATGLELIVCLFTKKTFVRCFYLPLNASAELTELPSEKLYVTYSSGSDFDYLYPLDRVKVKGAFTRSLAFYMSKKSLAALPQQVVTLGPGLNEGFERTDEVEFFKRRKN